MGCTRGKGQRCKWEGGTQTHLQKYFLFTLGLRGSSSRDLELLSSLVEPRAWFLSLLVRGYVHHQLSEFSHQNIRIL